MEETATNPVQVRTLKERQMAVATGIKELEELHGCAVVAIPSLTPEGRVVAQIHILPRNE